MGGDVGDGGQDDGEREVEAEAEAEVKVGRETVMMGREGSQGSMGQSEGSGMRGVSEEGDAGAVVGDARVVVGDARVVVAARRRFWVARGGVEQVAEGDAEDWGEVRARGLLIGGGGC